MKTKEHNQKNNSGWTLVEMLVYGVLLMVIVNAGMKLSISAARISAVNALAKDRLLAVQDIDSAFRNAVRGASGVLEGAGKYNSSESVAVLRLGNDAHVRVLGAVFAPDQFSVLDLERVDGDWTIADMHSHSLPLENIRVSQAADTAAPNLFELRYRVKEERGERVRTGMSHRVLAAMPATSGATP